MSFIDQNTFSELSDVQLIELARVGDYDALTALLLRYVPLCKSRTAHFASHYGLEFDDLYQESMLGLFGAFRSFKEGAAPFSAFARLCIDRSLISSIRSADAKSRFSTVPAGEMLDDAQFGVLPSGLNDPQDIVIADEAYENLKTRLKDELSALEYDILCRYLNGEGYETIADGLNISVKSVDNALQRMRRKFK